MLAKKISSLSQVLWWLCALPLTVSNVVYAQDDYNPFGVQTNVPETTVTDGGWTQCFSESYDSGEAITTILAACNRERLMLACRPTGSPTLSVLAQAPRAAVTPATTQENNGVLWYFNSTAWGFANGGDTVNLLSGCDNETINGDTRLCWSVDAGNTFPGFRCGNDTFLGAGTERVIYHSDIPPQPSLLSITDATELEGDAGVTTFAFTVTLTPANDAEITVEVDTADGSATDADNDYEPTSQLVTFPIGITSQLVTVDVNGDLISEADETFFVNLSNPSSGAALLDSQGRGDIVNDDDVPQVTISLSGSPFSEAGGVATVTANLSGPSSDDVTIDFDIGGTATGGGVDYTASTNQIVILAGDTSGTITLTAVEDAIDEPNETIVVNVAAVTNAVESGEQGVVAVIIDNDGPLDVTLSLDNDFIAEAGGAATVTAILSDTSSETVVVDLAFTGTASNGVDYNASGAQIVIAPSATTGSITLTALGDNLDELDETIIVDIAAVTNADETTPQQVTTTIVDDDSAGFTVTETDGDTQVTEPATTDTFSVVLTAQPLSDVEITVISTDTEEATITSLVPLTFTNADWNIPQDVTVTAADDEFADGAQLSTITLSINDANSDDSFDPVPDQFVTVTTLDDEIADFTLTPPGGISVTESGLGNTNSFDVALTARPEGFVFFEITSTDLDEVTVNTDTLLFTTDNWDTPQSVEVAGADDGLVDGPQITDVIVSVSPLSDPVFAALLDKTIEVTTTDDDTADVTVAPQTLQTTEGGDSATFDVVLTAEPTAVVTIPITNTDVSEGQLSDSVLVFTPGDWDQAQTVTVTGVDDNEIDGNVTYFVILEPVLSADPAYGGAVPVDPDNVEVTNLDDDAANFSIDETGGTTEVSEAGATDTFSVVLNTQPSSDVTITLTNPAPGEINLSVPSLTFTSLTWFIPQTVNVSAVDDTLADGNQTVVVTLDVAAGSDADFLGLTDSVSVTSIDDDSNTLLLTLTPSTVREGDPAVTATLTRNTGTVGDLDVIVRFEPETDEATINYPVVSPLITIPDGSASVDFTIDIVDDLDNDGDQTATIVASTPFFAGTSAELTVRDNDIPTLTLTIDETSINENGGTSNATVTRNNTAGDLDVTLTSNDTGEATVPLTVTILDGQDSAPFTITGVDDDLVDGTQTVVISASADGTLGASATIDVDDDDGNLLTLTIVEDSISENGGTSLATVTRNNTDGDLVVTLTSDDPGEATVPPSVTIDDTESSATFIITGVDDDLVDDTQTVVITAVAGAPDYNSPTDSIDVEDDDLATLTLTIVPLSVGEGNTINATVSRNTDTGSALTVDLSSAPPGEVDFPVNPVTIPAGASETTFDIEALDDGVDDGTQTVTITASVVAGGFIDGVDTIDVNDVVTPDLILTLAPDTIAEDAGADTVTATVARTSSTVGDLLVILTNNDPSEADVPLDVTIPDGSASVDFSISPIDDGLIDGDQTFNIIASADSHNDGVAELTVTDAQMAGIIITESGGSTSVNEDGITPDTFEVSLTGPPDTVVVLSINNPDTDEVIVDPAQPPLIFTVLNWDDPIEVTVFGVDDDLADGDQQTVLSVEVDTALSDPIFATAAAQPVTVTTVDDDMVNISVITTGDLTTDENGDTAAFDVVLSTEPTAEVEITLFSDRPEEGIPDQTTLSFTAANWDIPQTVTGVDDFIIDGLQAYNIVFDSVSSLDLGYDGFVLADVPLENADNDDAGFTISESGGTTEVTEGGAIDSFTVVLNTQPISNVVIDILSADPDEVDVTVTPLTFTPTSWDSPQTVPVFAVDDAEADGTQIVNLDVSVNPALSDDAFDLVAPQTVEVTSFDNDDAILTLTLDEVTISENGGTATATLSRNTTVGDLSVLLINGDPSEIDIPPFVTIFDGDDFTTFTVTGVDDAIADGPVPVTIETNSSTFSNDIVNLIVLDDDVQTLTLSIDPTSISEPDGSATATVTRNSGDNSSVLTVNLSSDDSSAATVEFASVDIPALADSTTFQVNAVDDDLVDGTQTANISASATGFVTASAPIDVLDDDSLELTLTIDDTNILENGGSTTATIFRNDGAGDITLFLSSSDPGEATVPPTVDMADGETSAIFIISGVDDTIVDGPQTVVVSASNPVFTVTPTANLIVDDDDLASLTLDIVPLSVGEGTTVIASVSRNDDPISDLTVNLSALPADEVAFPVNPITIPAGSSSTTFAIDALDDGLDDGTQTVTITATAGGFADGVDIIDVNDTVTPSLTLELLPDTIAEDAGPDTVSATVSRSSGTSGDLLVTLINGDPSEATVPPTVTIPDGSDSFTFTLSPIDDGLVDGDQSFSITARADGFNDAVATLTVSDAQLAEIIVTESDGSTSVNEAGMTADTFEVSLAGPPSTFVVISINNPDPGEVLIDPQQQPLIFTVDNWDDPILVTVFGVDDDIADGPIDTPLTVGVDTALSDPAFAGATAQTVIVTTIDDDTIDITVDPTDGLTTSENGDTDVFSVVLNTEPAFEVRLTLSSDDPGEGIASPNQLTFTPLDWDQPQIVTVTGVDDDIVDGLQPYNIVFDPASSLGEDYDGFVPASVLVNNSDNDIDGFTITESDGTTEVSEDGVTDNFTVVLDTEPLGDVVIDIISSDPDEADVNIDTLTFTPDSWDSAQTVTVFAIDDIDADGDQLVTLTVSVNTAASDPNFPFISQDIQVNSIDNDGAALTLTLAQNPVNENDGTTEVTITRNTDTTNALFFLLQSTDTTVIDVPIVPLTIPAGEVSETVIIDIVDDALVEADQTVTITAVAIIGGFDDGTADILVLDDDIAALTISIDPTSIDENGGTATATVTRNTDTAGPLDVDINNTDSDNSEVDMPSQITILAGNDSEIFTINAINDDIVDGTQTVTITVSSGLFVPDNADIDVTDDDGDQLTLTINDPSISENGGVGLATVRRNTDTTNPLTINLTSDDETEATVSSPVIIEAGNDSVTFPINAVDDAIVDGTQTVTITASATSGGFADVDATIDITDDDNPTLTLDITPTIISETGTATATVTRNTVDLLATLTVTLSSSDETEATVPATVQIPSGSESATFTVTGVEDFVADGTQPVTITASEATFDPATFDIVVSDTANQILTLAIDPTSISENGETAEATLTRNTDTGVDLTVELSSNDTSEATVPADVTILAGSDSETFTITAVDDTEIDGNQLVTISASATGFNTPEATLTVTDDEVAGILITEIDTTVDEDGDTGSFSVTLTEPPVSAVLLNIVSSDEGEVAITSATTLFFNDTNWDDPQTVTLIGVDDPIVDGDQTTNIVVSVDDAFSDDVFDGLQETVAITTLDNDTADVTVTPLTLQTTEGGDSATFDVVLTAQPTAAVTIPITNPDVSEGQLSDSVLTFTPDNWDQAQTVTVTGVDDAEIDGNITYFVLLDPVLSVDPAYGGAVPVDPDNVEVTNLDDDAANFSINESDGTTEVSEAGATDTFSVVLNTQPSSDVTITLTNPATDEINLSTLELTFTPLNWFVPQPVSVSAIDDDIADGNQTVVVTLDVTAGDPDFLGLTDSVSVTSIDDDSNTLLLTLTPSTAREGDPAVTATLTRNTGTVGDLDVIVRFEPATDEATINYPVVSPLITIPDGSASVDFTIDIVDDLDNDGDQTATIIASTPSFADASAELTVRDNDIPTLMLTIDETNINENGGTSSATVTRNNTDGDLDVTLTSNDTDEATVPPTVTILDGQDSAPFTITGVDDDIVDGTQTVVISASADGTLGASATIDVDDDDGNLLTLTIDEDSISENGGTSLATVTRNNTDGDLVVTLTSDDPGEATVPPSVTINDTESSATFIITGVDDDLVDDTQTVVITAVAGAPDYNSPTDSLDVEDDDLATLTLTIVPLSVGEGNTISATVSRNTDTGTTLDVDLSSDIPGEVNFPINPVTIPAGASETTFDIEALDDGVDDGTQTVTITASATAGGFIDGVDTIDVNDVVTPDLILTLAPDTIAEDAGADTVTGTVVRTSSTVGDLLVTLTNGDPSEADVPLDVTIPDGLASVDFSISPIDDGLIDGDQTFNIIASADDHNDGVAELTVTDAQMAGIIITESGGSTSVNEDGITPDTFEVSLTGPPATVVVISFDNPDPGEVIIDPTQLPLIFTALNWADPIEVTVFGVDDDLADGDQQTVLSVGIDTALSDPIFASAEAQPVTVTTIDDDMVNISVITTGDLTTSENGDTAAFDVVLSAEPTAEVQITLSSDRPEEGIPDQTLLSFTAANWDIPQTVTVTGVDDFIIDGLQPYNIVFNPASSLDTGYNGFTLANVPLENGDNDDADFTISESGGTTEVAEGGAVDSFTVVLNIQPLSDVVIDILSADPAEVDVNITPLTFTPDNWNSPQTVTVFAVDELDADGTQIVAIDVSVDPALSDDAFDLVAPQAVEVTSLDNDSAVLTLTLDQNPVDETAGTVGATLIRNTNTDEELFVFVTSSNPDLVTVPDIPITIPIGETSVPLTITIIDNDDDEGNQTVTITADALDDDFTDGSAELTVLDDDVSTLTLTIEPTEIPENGGTATATITRNSDTTDPLVVNISSSNTDEAIVPASTVAIGAGNASETFTITAVDDVLVDGTQTVTINAFVDGFIPDSATIDILDDDSAQLTLTISDDAISENGGVSIATVSRNDDTGTLLTVSLDSDDTTEASVPVSVDIPIGESSASFVIVAENDSEVDGTQTVTITATAGALSATDVIDIEDDDGETLTLTIDPISISENGGVATATVSRNSSTATALVIDLASDDISEATVPDSVEIPAGSTSITFDVTAVDDAVADGTQTVTITASATDFSDGTATVAISDDESPTLILTLDQNSVLESVGSFSGTVTRNTDTTDPLEIELVSSDPDEAGVGTPVTILAGDDSATITIFPINDSIIDGTQTVTITASADGFNDALALLTVLDDEEAGFLITETGVPAETVVSEPATTDTFTVVLTAQPSGQVVLNLDSLDTGEVTVDPPILTIPGTTWNTPRTVTVTAVDDLFADGNQLTPVVISVNSGLSDDPFDSLSDQTVQVTTMDDEVPFITVNPTGGLTTTENGGSDSFTVVLNTPPLAPVQVDITSLDPTEGTVSPDTLTFDDTNWNIPQPVTVIGVDDFIVDGDVLYTIVPGPAVSGDPAYDGFTPAAVSVTNTDDDIEGFSVIESDGNTQATEGGATDTIGVVLDTQPTSDVVISIINLDPSEVLTSSDSLTFTSSNWFIPQIITVTALDDTEADGNQIVPLTFSINDALSDDTFDDVDDEIVNVTTIDNDSATLTLTLNPIAISENGTATSTATLSRNTGTVGDLPVSLTSSDTSEAIVPVGGTIIPDGSDSVMFDITAVDDALIDGIQEVTITASADDFAPATALLAVVDDDPGVPTLTLIINDADMSENGGSSSATVFRNTDTSGALAVELRSSNTAEATVPATVTIPAGSDSAPFTITAVDELIVDGTQTVTITALFSGFVSGIDTIDVTDDDVSQLTLTIEQASISENGGLSLANLRRNTNIDSDLAVTLSSSDTSEATVSASVTIPAGDTNAVFLINAVDDAIIDGNQTVTITAIAGIFTVTDTIDVIDDEGGAMLSISISPASISENGGTATVTVSRSGPTASALSITLASNDTSEATVPTNATIDAGQSSVNVTLTAVDDALSDGTQTVTITASADGFTPVNDNIDIVDDEEAPMLTLTIDPTSISENGGTATVTVTRSGDTSGNLTVTLESDDTSEATVPPGITIEIGEASQTATLTAVDDTIIDGTQTVTITASADSFADATATIDVTDDDAPLGEPIFSDQFED